MSIWEGTNVRYGLGVILPVLSFKLKCAVAFFGTPFLTKHLGITDSTFDRSKQLRFIGWDYASAALGVTIFAILSETSGLRAKDRNHGLPVTLIALLTFVIFFIASVTVRYLIQEQREKEYADSRDNLRYRESVMTWAMIGWVVGIICYGVGIFCAIPEP